MSPLRTAGVVKPRRTGEARGEDSIMSVGQIVEGSGDEGCEALDGERGRWKPLVEFDSSCGDGDKDSESRDGESESLVPLLLLGGESVE